jgi:hypothetical protein
MTPWGATRVKVVANAPLRAPADPLVELILCPGFGAVDDWFAERAGGHRRHRGHPAGRPLPGEGSRRSESEGTVLHGQQHRRRAGDAQVDGRSPAKRVVTGGPALITPKDRSRFLSKLDEAVNAVYRAQPPQE